MKQFSYVEDYLEVIAGLKDIVTGKQTANWIFGFTPIINLARYDVDVLTSMSEATSTGKALTERQATLATKIILKYQRQLAAKGVDVTPVLTPTWRLPLRVMDYSRVISIVDDQIILKFPYTSSLIDSLRAFRKESQGRVQFNKDTRQWAVALTEYNLNWLHTWATVNEFEISPEVSYLINLLLDAEKTPYKIELYVDDQLSITNCPGSLKEHIEAKLGGWDKENLLTLADYSSILGYTIDPTILEAILQEYGSRFLQLITHREVKINPESHTVGDNFASVLEYATSVNRLPVVIYEPDLSEKMLKRLKEIYPDEQIYISSKNLIDELPPEVKFIYTIKPIRNLSRIPMLISGVGMIFGPDKQVMVQFAEKIVYCAVEVYNKNQQGRKVVKIAS